MAEHSATNETSPEPVSCLRVFPPDTDPFDYPLTEGESSIGRGEDCDVTLSTGSLSRKHAMILVEQGSHFVMDLGSRNKTFRKMVTLKPNIYYELTDGIELTFANLTCHYLIPEPETEGDEEETQDYGAGEVTKDEADEESEGSTVCDPSEAREGGGEGEGGEDDEPTQAYDLDSPRSDGEGAPMDIEPTVAYDLQDLEEGDKEEENDDSVASSPLLVGGPRLVVSEESPSKKTVSFIKVPDKPDEATPISDNEATQVNTDSETDNESPKPGPTLERGITEQMDTAPPIDPTVLYDFDTDTEEDAIPDATSSDTIPNKDTTSSENEVTSSDKGTTSSNSGVETRASDVEDTEPVVEPAATEPTNDSDSTDIEEDSPVIRKPVAAKKKGVALSSDEDEGSGTEENKEPPLKPQPSTVGGLSLMDFSEQGPPTLGAGTLILPSYEESYDPEDGEDGEDGGHAPTLTKGTTVVMESYQSTCVPSEGETPVINEDSTVGGNSGGTTTSVTKDEAVSDDEQPVPKVEVSKQRTFALSSLSGRGKRGRAKRGTRGRKPIKQSEPPELDTEALLNFGREDSGPKVECKDPPPSIMAATLSVAMDVDSTLPATLKLDTTITEDNIDPPPKGLKVKRGGSSKRGRGGRRQTSRSKTKASVVESNDLLEESPDLTVVATTPEDKALDDQSDSISEQSSKESTSSQSGRGKRGRGRAKKEATRTPSVRRTPTSSRKVSASATETPRVMFTGLIDEDGQRSVQDLGGEMVDSVYQCTHLITDKVRRTVKFLCCLSRGCLIVNSNWLSESALAGQFLPAEPFIIKDRSSERQFNFSLVKSHHSAKLCKVLEGYTVYLTANIKPQREQMADIIKCSGGEPLDYTPSVTPGDKVIVITCKEDLGLTSDACVAGVPLCSTELVLGGVLRQEVDIDSHTMETSAVAVTTKGRKRVAKEQSTTTVPAKRRRK